MAKLTIPPEEQLEIDLIGADMAFIEQLVMVRKRKGLTQRDIAQRMGVDRSVVSRFESISQLNSKNHTLRTARRYAEAVGAYSAHIVIDADESDYSQLAESVEENLRELAGEKSGTGAGAAAG
ncbi:helix-turn-helix transcriptional regulator [Corynebacterium incognita]|uniref:Helix-turn-helix transcriptional regulator n=1 Tax=Corynebacterium incognita TaxID=2754725 RepID=A0A7G7CQS3_9CORY|nr:helix-turn-helix transcriptional regulator [Corynebacterium incognita]QNE89939.1 helix-turn-helix transcriptional regulator [Corynebacterium incognita]